VHAQIRRVAADLAWVKVLVGAVAALTAVVLTLTVDVQPAASPGRVHHRHAHLSAALLPGTTVSSVPTHPASRQPDVVGKHAEQRPGTRLAAQPRQPRVPVSVALDPTLTKPAPGDTAATLRARAALAKVDETYQSANQLYDQASADATAAAAEVVRARKAAATALDEAQRAHAEFAALITAQYQGGDTPVEAQLLMAGGPQDFLDTLDMQHTVAMRDADILTAARRTQLAAEAARQRVEAAEAKAREAQQRANAQLVAASQALATAQKTVTQLHLADLAAAAEARESTLGAAAASIRAQALASGAAQADAFSAATGPAQVIAIGTRALLQQAAGRRKPPPKPAAGIPPYERATGTPIDEQAVMGPTPDLGGTVPYTGTTGSGPVRALTAFDGVVSTSGWPNAGVGTKVRGTAPFQKPDGTSVHPVLPDYRKGYTPLRAEVAVDSALEQLGSPYVWDAAGPDTFDCSGLMLWAWGHAGVALDHFTGDQVHEGVTVAPNELLPGDLLLFGKTLHHVGMYLGAGYMIDAPNTGDYVKVQLVSDDGDFAVAVRP
jgi:cell wall-associated NlpC family hydrolase